MIDYNKKYLKYKSKYLKLKTLFGGEEDILETTKLIESVFNGASIGVSKRLKNELKKLRENGYTIDYSQIQSKKLILTDIDGSIVEITIPMDFPFHNITLYKIQQKINTPLSFIVDLIAKIPYTKPNVLVYCHPYKIDKEGHYLYNLIQKSIKESGLVECSIYTLDISGDPNILADGFSDEFINRYSINPSFDIVFLLDCAGPWEKLQKPEFYNFDAICVLIDKVLKIVKQNGKLIISKIIAPELYEKLLSHYSNSIPFISEESLDKVIQINKT